MEASSTVSFCGREEQQGGRESTCAPSQDIAFSWSPTRVKCSCTATGVTNKRSWKTLIFKEKSTYSSEQQNNLKPFLTGISLTSPENNLRTVEAAHGTALLLGAHGAVSCSLPEFVFQGFLKRSREKSKRLLLQKYLFKLLLKSAE